MNNNLEISIRQNLSPTEIDMVSKLFHAVSFAIDHPPLGEHRWLDLVIGGRQAHYAILASTSKSDSHLVGYAQISASRSDWAIDLVVHPRIRGTSDDPSKKLLSEGLNLVSQSGGGHVHWWVPRPNDLDDELAKELHFARGRDLMQLRCTLPLPQNFSNELEGFEIRGFETNKDELEWLEVNNQAFAWHPEQGGWTLEILRSRQKESWFDPNGFLIHEIQSKIAGFCWTKVHRDANPVMGEIYVIAVHPRHQSSGIGRKLVIAGLDYLAKIDTQIGMLYVDSTNKAALGLYYKLGFETNHIDRAYVFDAQSH